MTGDEPSDVLSYHREHPDFPHQTTADQWFSESQFESYRRLGQHVVEELFQGVPVDAREDTKEMFARLEKNWPGDDPKKVTRTHAIVMVQWSRNRLRGVLLAHHSTSFGGSMRERTARMWAFASPWFRL